MNFSLHTNLTGTARRFLYAQPQRKNVCSIALLCLPVFLSACARLRMGKMKRVAGLTLWMTIGILVGYAQTPSLGDYQSVSSGNWSNLATWQRFNGSDWITPTAMQGYPGQNTGTDDVWIQNGHTVTIDVSPAQPISDLYVGQGISGILQYEADNARTLTVSGVVTISHDGVFCSASTGTVNTHQLVVETSIVNQGTLNFSNNTAGVGITFSGDSNGLFDLSAATLTNLMASNGLVLNKGNNVLSFTPGGTFQVLSANAAGFLTIQSGMFNLIGVNSFNNPLFYATTGSYTIPSGGGFTLNNRNANISGVYGTLTNNGTLIILNGVFNIGDGTGNESLTTSTGTFEMSGGQMYVSGRFRIDGGECTISGGELNLATIGHADRTLAAFHISGSAVLTINGNPLITFAFPNSNTTPFNDLEIVAGSGIKTITGGTFQLGTSATPSTRPFLVNSDIPLYNMVVYSANTRVVLSDHLTINNQLTLNGQLLMNNYNLNLGAPAVTGNFNNSTTSGGLIVPGTGRIHKTINSTGSYVFPFGNSSATYLPVTLNFTAGSFTSGATASVSMVDDKHPQNTNTTNYLTRYWMVRTLGITSPVYNFTGTYANITTDVRGDEAFMTTGVYTTVWRKLSAANNIGMTIYAAGLTGDTDITGINSVAAPPVVTVSPNTAAVCSGSSVQLTANVTGSGPFTYSWTSNPAGYTSTAATINVNPVNSTTYTIAVTDGMGETATVSVPVTVNPQLVASVSIVSSDADNIICAGTEVTFTATPTNGGTPSYQWYEGTTPVGTNSPIYIPTNLTSGQPVTVVMTSTAACTTGSPATSNVIATTVNPQLPVSVNIVASANPVCAGPEVTFTATPVNGGDAPQYEWRVNNISRAGASGAVFSYTPSDGDMVTCVLTSNALCATGSPATSNAVSMVVHTLPAASISVTREVCKDAPSPNVTFTGNSGTAPYTFTYSVNNGASQTVTSTGNTATVAVSTGTPGDFVYTLVSVQDAYCSQLQTGTATITVNPLPIVTISSNSPQCVGSILTLTASGGVAYHWTGPNGYTSDLQNPSISNVTTNAAGTYTVRVADANGCEATASTSVVINPAPTVSITASPGGTICRGTNVTFTTRVNNAGGTPTFQWQINEVDVLEATSSTFSTTTLANSQRVRVIVTADPAYCSSKATSNVITMTVNDPVTPTVSILESRNNICSGTSVTFTSLVANGGSATTYQWQINGTNVIGATNATFSSNVLNDGDQVSVIIQSNATCVTSSTATSNTVRMIVNPILTPSVTITANPSIAVCPGTSVTFTASSTNAGTNPVYQWRVNNTNVGTNSPSFTTTTLANNDVVSVRMTSNALCVSEANVNSNDVTVAINPGTPALPGAVTGNPLACPNTTEIYSISPVTNATSYTWTLPSGWTLTNGQGTNSITVTSGTSGQNGTITVIAANSCGTSGVRTLAVSTGSISTPPTGITIANNNTCSGTIKTLTVSGGSLGTGASWQWFTGSCGGTLVGTGPSITANPASGTSTTYYVRASGTCNTTTCAEGTVIVSPGAPDQPQAITGGASPVCPGSNLTYSIPAVNNATSYNWTAPTGWNITSGQGSASITVTAGAAGQNGNISVMAVNSCGSSTARTLAVTVAPGIPAIPGPIAGNSDQCVNSTGRVYSVTPVSNATSYDWTLPSGWTITSGVGTNSITVSTNGSASSGNISVIARNSCGSSTAYVMPVYIVTTVPSTPGAINGLTAICPVKSVVYSVSPVPGAISYTWSVPNNWSISSGQGTASVTVQVPSNAASGNVSVVANNVCGPSLASTLPVTVANTAWVNAGINQVVCQGTASVRLNGSVGGAIKENQDREWDWDVSAGNIVTASSLSSVYNLPNNGNTPGVYTVRILSNVNAVGCNQTIDEMTVTVLPNPNASVAITGNNPVCIGSSSTITITATANTTVTYTINNGTNQTINVGSSGTASLNTGALTANAAYQLVSVGYTAIPACPQTLSGSVTITVNPLATVNAGPDLTICAGNTAPMAGTFGGGATSGTWTTSGSGSFNNINSPTAVYTPGAADVTAGTVTLTYTTDDPNGPCMAVSDVMVLTINPVAIINAGNDQTICAGNSATMNGSLGGSATSGTWTTSGTGTFSNNSSSAVYTPGAADVSAGTVTLTYTSNDPNGPCPAVSDAMVLTINPLPIVNAGFDQSVCATSAITLTGTVNGPVSTGTWSGGSGSFSNTASLNTVYTPSAEEISDGTVTLTLTSANPAGPCETVSDQVTITITPAATVNAGVDQDICEGSTAILRGTIGGAAGSATWTGGTGTFTPNNTTLNATYQPGVNETGDVTLTLTTDDPASSCNAASDQMIIHLYPRAIVNAGPDLTICSNGMATMAGSVGGSAHSGRWTTSGGGTFNNPTSASAVYTPGNSDISNGSVALTFTSDDPDGPCGPVSDAMVLTINHAVQITSQPVNTGVCATDDASFTVSAVGDNLTYQWYRVTTSGAIPVVTSPNLTGVQTASLHFDHATSVDEGSYYVMISGAASCAPVPSSTVTLNVDQEITIKSQFQTTTVCVGEDITFNIEAEPGGQLTFQWRKDGVNLPNATGNTYTLNDVTLANGGSYDVVIAGMAGYTCSSARSAAATLTVTPSVEIPVFASGATSNRCQGAGTVSYAATANNSTGITYGLDAASLTGGNTINASTGAVTFAAGWAGSTTITASAAGCNGPATATHTVTITPTVTIVPFTSLTSTRCQGAGTVTYSTTASNSTGITYSLDAASLTGGNTINATTGAVTFAAGWAGSTTITASAAGCNGPATATHTVTITPTVTIAPFSPLTSIRCQGAGTVTYSTTASNSTGITYSLDATTAAFAGNSINASTGAVIFAAGWAGSTTITASATGCNGPATATHTVTVTPTVTIAPFGNLPSTRCQGVGTVTYTATATNSTGITYSLDAATAAYAGNSINASTGAVIFAAGWAGSTTITASAAGCNGPATATHTVTVTPTVTIVPFSPLTSMRCQGAGTVTYSTTAANSTGITYSLDAATAAFAGNSINASTGAVIFAAGWAGSTTITASAAGCNGPVTTTHTVTVTPTVTIAPFANLTSTRCQGAGTVTYSTTATNSTGITYRLDDASLAGGNTINASTGAVTYAAGWSNNTTITASAAGCNGPATASHTVITDPTSVRGTLSPYTQSVCTTTNTGSLTLSGHTGVILRWESSTNAGGSWTNISNTSNTYNFSNLPLTTIFRVLVKSGACPEVYSAPARVVVIPLFEPIITATTVDICNGNSTILSVQTGLLQPVGAFTGGGFNQANPIGWRVSQNGSVISPFPAAGDNRAVGPWAETNGPRTFNGVSYDTQDNTKFTIVNGAINSTLETPVFNLFGLPSAELTFRETHNLAPGATARVELSTDGGNSYNIVLATYTGSTGGIINNLVDIDMSPYIGMMNLRIRFNYSSPGAGGWALDGISIPSQQTDVTYTWSPAETLSSTKDSVVIATPGTTTTYTLTMMVSGCPIIAKSIVIGVANPPVVQTTNACIGAGPVTFTQTGGTLGGSWRVSGGGTINAAGVFTPATPGCFNASYITPSGTCGDTVSFMVFPAAPLPVVNAGCGPIVLTPPPAIPGFTLQYSFDNGTTWGGSTPPTAENCAGYQIRTRYITTLTCDAATVNPTSSMIGCDRSAAVTRVVDRTAPVIACPADVTASTNPDACYATLVLGTPVVTDNCSATTSITITNNAPAQFPIGETLVTWTAVDACGNQSTCTQRVIITDNNQAPVFTSCPGNQVQTALPGNCSLSNVIIPNPVATDNCAVTRLTWAMSGATNLASLNTGINYVSGQTFNVGITKVTYTAYDAAGNPSQPCSFDVWIKDLNKPVFTVGCPENVTQDVDAGKCTAAVTVPVPDVTDPCNEGYTLTNSINNTNNASGNYNVGTTLVTWTITDLSGNITTCEQTITINDVLPTIICPPNVADVIAADGCSKTDVTVGAPTFTGNCANPVLSYRLSGVTTGSGSGVVPSSQAFNIGVTTVTYTVTDSHNNTTSCNFTVTVRRLNIPPPVIHCPESPAPVTAVAGTCFAQVTVAAPVEEDPCETVSYTFINDFNHTSDASGSYPVGTTTVTWTITDNSGNTMTCQQTVIVNDLPPTISCPAPVTAQADFELPYQDAVTVPAPSYSDNCPNAVLSWTLAPPAAYASEYDASELSGTGLYPSPSTFYLGVSTITYTVTDSQGNKATCSFTVAVLAEPEITCLPAVSYYTDPGQCTASRNSDNYGLPTLVTGVQPIRWTWTITNPDGTQGATGSFIGSATNPGPPAIPDYAFQQGTSTITWRAENISGFDECTQNVTVSDNQAPTFTVPSTITKCVESILWAVYNPNPTVGNVPEYDDLTTPRPDYYLFTPGSTTFNLDAEANNFSDNCCQDNSLVLHWRIDFTPTPNPATAAHEMITKDPITGTGQPSLYTQDIQFPGDGVTFHDVIHQLTYWLVDCNENQSQEQHVQIIIQPRPQLTKGN